MAFLIVEFLGQDRTLSSWNAILYPWSASPEMETRFLLIPGTYRTFLSWSVIPEFSCIEQEPIPLIGWEELSPIVTSSDSCFEKVSNLSLNPVIWREAPLSMIQVLWLVFNPLERATRNA